MIPVVDRVPTYPNRIKLIKSNGTSEYVTWERADEPIVEGTPINRALFESIATDIGMTGDRTVFVSPAGSDNLGEGTAANPFGTIQRAVDSLPKNLNGKNIIINLATGSYNERVNIKNFTSGTITINGVSGAGVTITGLSVENALVLVDAINLNVGNGGIFVGSMGMLFSATSNITVNGATNGVTLRYGAVLEISTTLTVNNATTNALWVQYASTASVANFAGTGNGIGVQVLNSNAYVLNFTLTAGTRIVEYNGKVYERVVA